MAAQTCRECQAELPPQARFCAYCGIPVSPASARGAYRSERRVITALFADLAGSTKLGERLDPEDFRDLTGGALAVMGVAIEELGGTVRGTAGDGVLGLFGAPTMHEDDAERAVLAGLRLVQRMRGFAEAAAEEWGVADLHVRVGIESGLAVLGEVRAGSQTQYDASGDCLNTAARLEGAADIDGVLVGPAAHRIVGEAFDWGDLRSLTLKGKAEPVVARHALGSRDDRPRVHVSRSRSRLVGRGRELAMVGELVADVRAGSPRIVVVSGQAGIGKTRFIRELRMLLEAPDHAAQSSTWLEGTCLSYAANESYLPFRQILRQALGPELRSTEEVAGALASYLGEQRADEVAPLLGMVLGLQPGGDDSARLAGLSVESLRQAVTGAVAEVVVGLAARGPVAIALDDIQWADAASLRLAEGLVGALGDDVPVLLVVAMRPETDRAAWTLRERVLQKHPQRSVELRLPALKREEERRLIANMIGEGTLPEHLESVLLSRAEGNPFYLQELLRSLQDTGALTEVDGRWTFDRGVSVELPETVERVVLARIDRLPAGDRDLLNAAAVIGREFDLPLLGKIVDEELSVEALSNLTELGLFEHAVGVEFRFSHPLIQETAYLSMLRRGRSSLHARAAAALEQLPDDGSTGLHATLARHHSAAGHVAEAVRWHRLAALASQRVVALDEAVDQLDLAVAAAGSLDPETARALLPELHLLRGHLRGRTGDYDGGADDLRRAQLGARSVGDLQIEMKALNDLGWLIRVHGYEEAIELHQQALRIAQRLDDASAQVIALSRMSMIHLNQLQLEDGLKQAQRALDIARAEAGDQVLGTALDCLKLAALQLGDLELLERTATEIVAVQERAGDLYLLQWAYIEGATVPLARGELSQARAQMDKAIEINQLFSSDPVSRALILEATSWIDRADGDPRGAVAAVHRAMDTIGGKTTHEWSAWLEASLGSHLIEDGRVLEAIEILESALMHSEAIKSPNRAFRAASHLAWACHLVGDDRGAQAALTRARSVHATIAAPPGSVFLEGYRSYVALAKASIALGDPRGARELLVPLVEAARRNGWGSAERDACAVLALAAD